MRILTTSPTTTNQRKPHMDPAVFFRVIDVYLGALRLRSLTYQGIADAMAVQWSR